MNLPNKLTLFRVFLIPVFVVVLIFYKQLGLQLDIAKYIATGIFVLASCTDAIDGYIARKYNLITNFGKFMDPLADKMLTTAAFLVLVHYGRASVIAVMLILTREFVVSGIRLVAACGGKVIAASWWGKIKTIFQMVAIIVAIILLLPVFSENVAVLITEILVWVSAVITVVSGYDYVIKNIDLVKEAK